MIMDERRSEAIKVLAGVTTDPLTKDAFFPGVSLKLRLLELPAG